VQRNDQQKLKERTLLLGAAWGLETASRAARTDSDISVVTNKAIWLHNDGKFGQ